MEGETKADKRISSFFSLERKEPKIQGLYSSSCKYRCSAKISKKLAFGSNTEISSRSTSLFALRRFR